VNLDYNQFHALDENQELDTYLIARLWSAVDSNEIMFMNAHQVSHVVIAAMVAWILSNAQYIDQAHCKCQKYCNINQSYSKPGQHCVCPNACLRSHNAM
jgi:hypothetical protein